MEILDVDMQMVRDFLNQADAPFHIKSHFDNLVAEHGKEADRAVALEERVESLEQNEADEIEKLQNERNALQSRLDDIDGDDMRTALETIKYAFLDTMVHRLPMRRPTELLRIIEEALL